MGDENKREPGAAEGGRDPSGAEAGTQPASDTEGLQPMAAGSSKELTPGQRLLAKKTQKAEQKRELKDELKRKADEARKQEEAEVEQVFGRGSATVQQPDQVQRAAVEFSSYLQGHRAAILAAVLGVVGIGFAYIYGRKALSAGSVEQTGLLASAAEIANGGIDPSAEGGKDDKGKPAFATVEARDRAALDAYAKAVSEDPKSLAAGWARLAQASVDVQLGRFDDAAKAFEEVYASHRADAAIAARAVEGLGIALEASGKADDAAKRFEELKGVDKVQGAELADYHLARLKLAKNDRDAAKGMLKAVYDRLVEAAGRGERSAFLKGEVESRLAELDSKLVPNAARTEASQFSPEELQRLIEQMQRNAGAQGGAGSE